VCQHHTPREQEGDEAPKTKRRPKVVEVPVRRRRHAEEEVEEQEDEEEEEEEEVPEEPKARPKARPKAKAKAKAAPKARAKVPPSARLQPRSQRRRNPKSLWRRSLNTRSQTFLSTCRSARHDRTCIEISSHARLASSRSPGP